MSVAAIKNTIKQCKALSHFFRVIDRFGKQISVYGIDRIPVRISFSVTLIN